MVDWIGKYGLSPMIYLIEVGLLGFLILRGHARRLISILLYLASLLALDGIARPYVWARYGLSSREYAYFFWVSDVALTLAAFVLVCALFRRACQHLEKRMWHDVRRLLTLVFFLVLGISYLVLSQNFKNLFSQFIIEFQQNLYFTCLVLITLLYVLMQKVEPVDDELTLLVSGMGIQFAGPAASLALLRLAPEEGIARFLATYVGPLCTLGMLLIWFYAVAQTPKSIAVHGLGRKDPELAEAVAREA
ncbi:MAG TPA: hypothetical protein VM182_02625 [Terriglobia bacterium]|nr:hypothetical protein [Terriglobia bacterium]